MTFKALVLGNFKAQLSDLVRAGNSYNSLYFSGTSAADANGTHARAFEEEEPLCLLYLLQPADGLVGMIHEGLKFGLSNMRT